MGLKFDDCRDCVNLCTDVCEDCEAGEFFEEEDGASPCDFDDVRMCA